MNQKRKFEDEFRSISDLTGFDNLRAMIEAEKSRKKRKKKKKKKNNPLHTSSQPVDAPKVEQSDKVQAVPTAEELETKSVEDLDIDLAVGDSVETAGAQTELAPMAGVEIPNDSIRDDVVIVLPHASPATHDSLGIELSSAIESTKVVEPATIAGRLAEELSRPFNSDDYFAGLGAFLDTMRRSCVGLPMTRDRLIAHAAPTSEGVVDPNNLALIPLGGTPAADAEAIDAQIAYHKEQIVQLEAKKNGLPLVVPLGNLSAD